jgi:hypothetical protein
MAKAKCKHSLVRAVFAAHPAFTVDGDHVISVDLSNQALRSLIFAAGALPGHTRGVPVPKGQDFFKVPLTAIDADGVLRLIDNALISA